MPWTPRNVLPLSMYHRHNDLFELAEDGRIDDAMCAMRAQVYLALLHYRHEISILNPNFVSSSARGYAPAAPVDRGMRYSCTSYSQEYAETRPGSRVHPKTQKTPRSQAEKRGLINEFIKLHWILSYSRFYKGIYRATGDFELQLILYRNL